MSRATIADVARQAGVTKSTVSHALSGKRPVSPETRRRIEDAIARLGYRPNPVAQRLAAGRTGAIGLIYEIDAHRACGEGAAVLAAASAALSEVGFALVLFAEHDEVGERVQPFLESGLLDAVILAQVRAHDDRVTALRRNGTPFVMLGRTADNSSLSFVDVDIETAVELCVDHLVGLGHRQIGFLHEDAWASASAGRAVQAYERACARRRLRLIAPACPPMPDAARAAIQSALRQWPDVTAWIAPDEAVASLVCREVEAAGRAVPKNLSLVCLAKSPASDFFQPAIGGVITGVDLRPAEQVTEAVALLLERLNQPGESDRQVLLDPRWVDGGTTAPPPSIL